MYCKQCGNFVDENKDQFCMNCGMPVNQEQAQQIKQENEKKEGRVIYYVSEALSLFFIIAFLVNALNENIEAVSDLCYAFAMINLHKIMITKLVTNGEAINTVSIIIEKLGGLRANLLREETYIYENARKRNTKINVVVMIVLIILGMFFSNM